MHLSTRSMTGALILALGALPACDPDGREVPPEVAALRTAAARDACVATEVLREAESDVASLEETIAPTADADQGAEITRHAAAAALDFARAYEQHARLRAARLARIDSAFNHASRAADSVRHVQAAQELTARAPEPGTVEANVRAAYERDFAALRADEDHPCSWDVGE